MVVGGREWMGQTKRRTWIVRSLEFGDGVGLRMTSEGPSVVGYLMG